MRQSKLTTFLAKALDFVWWLSAVSTGVLVGLLGWSIVGGPPTPSSFALEVGLTGFNVQQPRADPASNLAIVLPVELEAVPGESERSAMKALHGNYRFPIRKGALLK